MAEPDHITSTRRAYDHSASLYVEHLGTELSSRFETAFDQSMLDSFASDVRASGGGAVLDVGCGPGRITAYLARRGLDMAGVDLSSAMIDAARSAHPGLSFDIGTLDNLGVEDRSLAAAVYWYSIIHTPPDQLSHAWIELRRVLQPGGHALIAFQSGPDEQVARPDAYGSGATLVRYHHAIDSVADTLEAAGLDVGSQRERAPELDHETTPQAFIRCRRPQD
ncbi:MAG: class I SAM-dependent methyltransferase [Acidimicrobiales bacterium]